MLRFPRLPWEERHGLVLKCGEGRPEDEDLRRIFDRGTGSSVIRRPPPWAGEGLMPPANNRSDETLPIPEQLPAGTR